MLKIWNFLMMNKLEKCTKIILKIIFYQITLDILKENQQFMGKNNLWFLD